MASNTGKKLFSGPTWEKIKKISMEAGGIFHAIGSCIYKLRKLCMAVPVLLVLFKLTYKNLTELPEQVGFLLQQDGTFAVTVSREFALFGPAALTLGCLLLMFLSKKALQPWIVSIFSLTLPLLIWLTNLFPG